MNDKLNSRDYAERALFVISLVLTWIFGLAAGLLMGNILDRIMATILIGTRTETADLVQMLYTGIGVLICIVLFIAFRRRMLPGGTMELSSGKVTLGNKSRFLPGLLVLGTIAGLGINGLAILISTIILNQL